jgi:hypothetical protein
MEVALKKESKKLYGFWAIVLGICVVLTLVVGVMTLRYGVTARASYQWKTSFPVNKDISIIETDIYWSVGEIYYGMNQTDGRVQTRYSIYYQKDRNPYILEYGNGYLPYNNGYFGEYYMHHSTGWEKFTYKLIKNNSKDIKSEMIIDLMRL